MRRSDCGCRLQRPANYGGAFAFQAAADWSRAASQASISARFQREHPAVRVYVAALDSHLDAHSYIVPGLGDAGDRIFGTKN